MDTKIRYDVIFGRITQKDENGNRVIKLDKNGKAPVVIQAYQNVGKPIRRYVFTGVKVRPEEWDNKKREVKGQPVSNMIIKRQVASMEDFELRFSMLHERPFSLSKDFDLMISRSAPSTPNRETSLTVFIREQVKRDKLSYSATCRYIRTVSNLTKYNQGKDVLFSSVNHVFVRAYEDFLRTVKKYYKNTIANEHKVIKQYLQRAEYMDLIKASKNPYHEFKIKKKPSDKDVLYPQEIQRIEELAFTTNQQHLEFCRDAFLFSIYTLLRIGDITSLNQSNLTPTDKGLILEIKAQKTKETNRSHKLPLYDLHKRSRGLSLPEQILKKYRREDNRPIFNRSHPKLNEHIKTIAKMAGIQKRVTFHTARHSGITWLVILKLELPHIQKLAQHANIVTTMQYVHLAEPIIGERLSDMVLNTRTRNFFNFVYHEPIPTPQTKVYRRV